MDNKLKAWLRHLFPGRQEAEETREVRRTAIIAVERKKLELGRALQELAEARQKNGSSP